MSTMDISKPNAGRIYDYILGGHHNFEADRRAADFLVKRIPFLPKAMRMQRWCLQDLAQELTAKRGYDLIVDFASGLPTQDNIHAVVPAGTTVIYSDSDPVVVEYARQILHGLNDVHIFQADARRPEELLNRPEVQAIIGERRDVGLVLWGVTTFLTDDEIAHVARYLYDWAGPRTTLAFEAQVALDSSDSPMIADLLKAYEQTGSKMHIRPLARFHELIRPWRVDGGQFTSLLEWHGFDPSLMGEEERRLAGPGGGNYGAYLVK